MQKEPTSNQSSSNEKLGFFDLIETRHSIRAFTNEKLEDHIIEKILSAANRAPSAGDLQSYQIIVITKNKNKKELADAAHEQNFINDASIVLVFCADLTASSEYGARGRELYCTQDATIACAYSQLAAHALGLGSVWVGSFDEESVKRSLSLSNDLRPVAMLVVGYPNEEPEITTRKSLNKISKRV